MLSLLQNYLYRLNIWLDKNELVKFIFMLVFVSTGIMNIQFGSLIFGVIMMAMLCVFALYRIFMIDGSAIFDRTKYKVPNTGESVLVTKDFYYDGSFRKFINTSDPSQKPNWIKIKKGMRLNIVATKETKGDWTFMFYDDINKCNITLNYFDTRGYWKSLSDIRDSKIKKLGI